MKFLKTHTLLASTAALAFSATSSSALVVMVSDLSPAGSPIEAFFTDNFTNVTEVRHGNWADFSTSQDALNGTGAYAGMGAADVFVIGRSLGSAGYQNVADGYNNIGIPFINMTSYTARELGNRLGWHVGSAANGGSRNGAETTVTAAGSSILGLAAGTHDLWTDDPNFNGLGVGSAVGGGDILATINGNILAAHWDAGDAPGNPTNAGVATFPATRLLLNVDNEPNAGNDGVNDFTGLTAEGLATYRTAIAATTPLEAIPEPSSSLLSLCAIGGLMLRRRR